MTSGLLVAAYLAVLNVARTRLGVPEDERGRARPVVLGGGALVAFGVIAALAGWSGPLLRFFDITPETFRIGAGFVAAIAGGVVLAVPRPAAEPVPRGWRAALWPVALPLLAGPEALALAVATGSQEGVGLTLGAAGSALAVLIALGFLPRRPLPDRVLLWASRVLGAVLLLVAIWLAVDGIRDV
jgi:small neutral amino acid transporter SnatA (MarC family)